MKKERVLIVGDDRFDMYAKALYQGFIDEGYENTQLFATNRYLETSSRIGKLAMRAQEKFAFGPAIEKINRELIRKVDEMKPELVFFYASRLVHASTVRKIKNLGSVVFVYNNDDPFASYFPKYFWRHYVQCVKRADKVYVYRHKNIDDCKKLGIENAELLRSYYIKGRNYAMKTTDIDIPRVIFLGHHENDEREEYIRALLDAGIEVGIMEKSWEEFEVGNSKLRRLKDSHKKYNEMLNAADIAIVFLSKINSDTYTRRCFEIPITKTCMVAPYTEDLASMFQEDKEVVFFRDKKDFVDKISYYLEHNAERESIAIGGYERVMKDGHEVGDRVKQIMCDFSMSKNG